MDSKNIDYESMDLPRIQDALQRVNFAAGKQVEETIKKLLEAALKKGVMPKTALQLGDDTMEAIYTQAYNLYNQGKYTESSYIFRLLMMLDPITAKYTLGVAACLHRMNDYQNAANIYMLCAALDSTNPLPHFHAADCYLKLKAYELAVFCLNMTISAAKDQPQYAVVKERATLMRDNLNKQLDAEVANEMAREKAEATTEKAKVGEQKSETSA